MGSCELIKFTGLFCLLICRFTTVKGCMNHGTTWQRHASKMNRLFGYDISRTSTYSELGLERPKAKYVIQCVDCNNEILRFKKSKIVTHINHYVCGKCNGKLKLV